MSEEFTHQELTWDALKAEAHRHGFDDWQQWALKICPIGDWPGRHMVDLANVGDAGFWVEDHLCGEEILNSPGGINAISEDLARAYISTHENYWGESYADYYDTDELYKEFLAGIVEEFVAFIQEWKKQVCMATGQSGGSYKRAQTSQSEHRRSDNGSDVTKMENRPKIHCPHCEAVFSVQRLATKRKYRNKYGLDVFECPECSQTLKFEPTEYLFVSQQLERGELPDGSAIGAVAEQEILPSEQAAIDYDKSQRSNTGCFSVIAVVAIGVSIISFTVV